MRGAKRPISHQNLLKHLHRIEDVMLIAALLSMIFITFGQIVLRNMFSTSFLWGDGAARYLVLWVALLGAMVATRDDNHITIDILSKFLPTQWGAGIRIITDALTAIITGVLTYASVIFLRDELSAGTLAFGTVPTWVAESIFPVAFMIITVRYVIFCFIHIQKVISGQTQGEDGDPKEKKP